MDHLQNALVKSLIFLYRGHEDVEQLTSFINSSLGHPFVFEIQLIKKHEQEIHEFSKGYLKWKSLNTNMSSWTLPWQKLGLMEQTALWPSQDSDFLTRQGQEIQYPSSQFPSLCALQPPRNSMNNIKINKK